MIKCKRNVNISGIAASSSHEVRFPTRLEQSPPSQEGGFRWVGNIKSAAQAASLSQNIIHTKTQSRQLTPKFIVPLCQRGILGECRYKRHRRLFKWVNGKRPDLYVVLLS